MLTRVCHRNYVGGVCVTNDTFRPAVHVYGHGLEVLKRNNITVKLNAFPCYRLKAYIGTSSGPHIELTSEFKRGNNNIIVYFNC